MDSRRGPRQYFRGSRSSNFQQFEKTSYETTSKYGYYKSSRAQRNTCNSYKRRSDYTYIRNYQSQYSRNRNIGSNVFRKSSTMPEDPEEEERKRKLSDTANKLLDKIKTWNAESNVNQDFSKSSDSNQTQTVTCDVNSNSVEEVASTCSASGESCNEKGGLVNKGKVKRIAHSKTKNSAPSLKKIVPKTNQTCKSLVKTRKYDVNKATVKDFQNRIQHKLINEIMQMPKESLQNVLNDPKINPIMELKMSHLVRENKLLIAQKLRALAESKMASSDFLTNSQLLVDIDKLIDPVIETDLSVLPFELIKQMESIFQVQFDYPNVRNSCEAETQSNEVEISNLNPLNICAPPDDTQMSLEGDSKNAIKLENCGNDINLFDEICSESVLSNDYVGVEDRSDLNLILTNSNVNEQILNTNTIENQEGTESVDNQPTNEDLRLYECSTDEDEDIPESNSPVPETPNQIESLSYDMNKIETDEELTFRSSFIHKSKRRSSTNYGNVYKKRKKNNEAGVQNNRRAETTNEIAVNEQIFQEIYHPAFHSVISITESINDQNSSENVEQYSRLFPSQKTLVSTSCQTVCELKSVGVQTSNMPDEAGTLYGVPLPQFQSDNSVSLLEEVTSIHNLVNKLNERRFMIFLQLAKSNPSGSFIHNKITNDSFIESLSNGNVDLVESLKQFFTESRNQYQTFNKKINKSKRKSK